MDNTTNYNLRKPSQFGSVNIDDLNYNADIIDEAIKAAKDAADDIDLSKKYEKPSTGIPKTDLASAVQTSLGKAETALQSATKSTVGLGNVDNTSDANKPVSTAQATAINAKYSKPSAGIPKTDLETAVQASLAKADASAGATALAALQTELTNHLNDDDDWSNTDYIPLKQKVTQHLDDYVKHSANGGTTAGTANAYTCNSSPNPAALVDKMGLVITIHVDSGSNPTLKWGSLVAKPIKKPNGSAAKLKKDGLYSLRYNSVNDSFILQGEGGGSVDLDFTNTTYNTNITTSKVALVDKLILGEEGSYVLTGYTSSTSNTLQIYNGTGVIVNSYELPVSYNNTTSVVAVNDNSFQTLLNATPDSYMSVEYDKNGNIITSNSIISNITAIHCTIRNSNSAVPFIVGPRSDNRIYVSTNGGVAILDLNTLTFRNIKSIKSDTWIIDTGATGTDNRYRLLIYNRNTNTWLVKTGEQTMLVSLIYSLGRD